MRSKVIGVTMVVVMMTGCAVNSVVPAGKDTYFISASSGWSESVDLKSAIYAKAGSYCQSMGKEFSPVSESHSGISAELTFRCFNKDSPDYQPPNMVPVPNVRIENK